MHSRLCALASTSTVCGCWICQMLCATLCLYFMPCEEALTCRAKRSQDERDAEARRYHKDTSTLSVKVMPVKPDASCQMDQSQ